MTVLCTTILFIIISSISSFTPQHVQNIVISRTAKNYYYHTNDLQQQKPKHHPCTKLHSLKPASTPLLDSGKALARSGELLIEYTSKSTFQLYGGGLSSTGASIRNAGDCIAQAAASTRFKTASELVCDELREAATCLIEGKKEHLPKGVDDANVDENTVLATKIESLIPFMECAGVQLELAGEKIMKMDSVDSIGQCLVESGECLYSLALGIQKLGDDDYDSKENDESINVAKESCNRMLYAADKMKEAGNNLKGVQPEKKKGKAWLKG